MQSIFSVKPESINFQSVKQIRDYDRIKSEYLLICPMSLKPARRGLRGSFSQGLRLN
jgi:hypothetical protein